MHAHALASTARTTRIVGRNGDITPSLRFAFEFRRDMNASWHTHVDARVHRRTDAVAYRLSRMHVFMSRWKQVHVTALLRGNRNRRRGANWGGPGGGSRSPLAKLSLPTTRRTAWATMISCRDICHAPACTTHYARWRRVAQRACDCRKPASRAR